MILRIISIASVTLCLLFSSCTCNKIVDAPINEPAFPLPTEAGPYTYTIKQEQSTLPSYMSDVSELTYRIPSSPAKPPFPTIIIEPGFFSSSTDLEDVENRYATHGFLVIGVNNTSHYNLLTTSLTPYANALLQTVRFTVESNANKTKSLSGLIDTSAIGISGHSMGGGGTIMAVDSITNAYNHYIKSAIAMNPYGKNSGENIKIPILLLASEKDSVESPLMPGVSAKPENVYFSYQSIPANTKKLFAIFKGMDHNAVVDANIFLSTSGNASVFLPTMISWFKYYLTGNIFYRSYLNTTGSGYSQIKQRFGPKGNIPGYIFNE